MNGVKPAIVSVVRIELEADKSARQKLINRHAVKDSRVPGETIEIQIGGRLLGIFIHDIERPVQVVDEDPPFASGLLPEKIDPREQSGTVAGAIDRARHGEDGEVFDLERQFRGSRPTDRCCQEKYQRYDAQNCDLRLALFYSRRRRTTSSPLPATSKAPSRVAGPIDSALSSRMPYRATAGAADRRRILSLPSRSAENIRLLHTHVRKPEVFCTPTERMGNCAVPPLGLR